MEDLDTVHAKLQESLKDMERASELVPFIDKLVSLTNLKAEICTALEEQCTKEKNAEAQDEPIPSVIRDLFAQITAPRGDDLEDHADEKEIKNAMKPRAADDDHHSSGAVKGERTDDDSKSGPGARKAVSNGAMGRNRTGRAPRYRSQPPSWSTSICYNCNGTGHFARECPARGGGARRFGGGGGGGQRCYHCGKTGHMARNCPDEGNEELDYKRFRCGKIGHWARDCELKKENNLGASGGVGGGKMSNDKCHRCGKTGHWARECDLPYQANNFSSNDKCHRCGETGHWARECSQPRNDGL